ncbi:acetate non-utilizing protein 9 [Boothiomyces sp. JEL0866]|nr:acetate non-utilizing protein 9 [Boothiomyces sp. JEL0866]
MSQKQILELYKNIRRLHRQLPPDLRFIGNRYVKEEFRLHKTAKEQYIPGFIQGWTAYKEALEDQVKLHSQVTGSKLSKEEVEALSPEQLGQLYELKKVSKPNK